MITTTPSMNELNAFPSTRWVRTPRVPTATRTDGIALCLRDGKWWVTHPSAGTVNLATHPGPSYFEIALSEVDRMFPPAPWTVTPEGVWVSDVWHVAEKSDATWAVYREIGGALDLASKQAFPSADRARRWAELRFDRGTAGLRGPKPRAGFRAVAKLPDVRVTSEEREAAENMLVRMNVNYSDFVRAAITWFAENVERKRDWEICYYDDGVVTFEPKSK